MVDIQEKAGLGGVHSGAGGVMGLTKWGKGRVVGGDAWGGLLAGMT